VAGNGSIYFELTPARLYRRWPHVADVELRQGDLVKTVVPDDATDSDPKFGFNIIQDVTRQAA
jgi:hypothetical protein